MTFSQRFFQRFLRRAVGGLLAGALAWQPVVACTGLGLATQDGAYISGRTAEFGIQLDLGAMIVPRGYTLTGTLPDGKPGMTYQARYAAVGVNAFGAPAIIDGKKKKGLAVGGFYFPGFAGYT